MTRENYDRRKERARKQQSQQSRSGRDVAPLPAVRDPSRRANAAFDFRFFCETYFADTFCLPWSEDHLKVMRRIEDSVLRGGQFAFAMPRGSGKTSLCEAAAIWATLYGHRRYVCLIGSDAPAAERMLESIKSELGSKPALLDDFPEVCHPFARLEGIPNRASGQTCNGRRTLIGWTADCVVFPTIAGSRSSGSTIDTVGITGSVRGRKRKLANGSTIRPDLCILDDPQTDDSARSPSQTATRERIINGAAMRLAGPGQKLAAFMPCTCIRRGDLADRHLERKTHPAWQGERAKLLYAWPADLALWQTYAELRADSLRRDRRGVDATQFYRANREAMDAGAQVAWPARHDPDELSALQHAMNWWIDSPEAFASEAQNEPLADHDDAEALTADQIAERVNGLAVGRVPLAVEHLTMFIDVQGTALFWTVCGWQPDFTGYVLDYGCFPEPAVRYFQLRNLTRTIKEVTNTSSLEGAIFNSLQYVCATIGRKDWLRDDGSRMRVERILIDANWGESTDTVYKFCRETDFAGIAQPSHGRYVGASSRMLTAAAKKQGERVGLNWRIPAAKGARQVRHVLFDANGWKSFVHARLRTTPADRGALTLYGERADVHRLFSEHLTAEYAVRTNTKDRTVDEWKIRPERPDNHWLDCVVGCAVAASILGCELREAAAEPTPRKRVKFSDMQKAKRAQRQGGER
jgi:hypothetical protein